MRKNITIDKKTIEKLNSLHQLTGCSHSSLIRKGIRLLDEQILSITKGFVNEGDKE